MLFSKELGSYKVLEEIFQNASTIIYHAEHKENRKRVILKYYNADEFNGEEITRYEYEYAILKSLDLPGVSKPIGLETVNNRPMLIMEDMQGEAHSLKNLIRQYSFDIKSAVKIFIKITNTLGQIHKNGIIHKDIKPYNIIVDPKALEVKIIDFGLATRVKSEKLEIINANSLEGTLFYISPEQTGRMNRNLDYRTDLYSLGVSMYEVFTGKLPFIADDPMTLIHLHIAKNPASPNQVNTELPKPLSDIILKLLSKTPEGRYTSSIGLQADLEEVLYQIESNQSYPYRVNDFTLAKYDVCDYFIIPGTLYGREKDIQLLLNSFNSIVSGKTEMVFVAGYSGIGKSVLVREIQKPVVERKGYFISGKFDQFKKNIPYNGFVQAFSNLVKQILTESNDSLKIWKESILNAIGQNGQVIIHVIPEIELIIGKQPVISELDPSESQNRFNLVFKNFIEVFTTAYHPLVIFLDDMQWADFASLNLLKILVSETNEKSLLVIGAYRDNEINVKKENSIHPLKVCIDELLAKEIPLKNITLEPLRQEHIENLIQDALSTSEPVSELAEIIFEKTSGNPFFVNEILKNLYNQKLLYYDYTSTSPLPGYEIGKWKWNLEEIKKLNITENVIDLMISKMNKLEPETQTLLKLAACLGSSFDLHTLSIINEKSYIRTSLTLSPAIEEGLIISTGMVHNVIKELDKINSLENIISLILKSSDHFLHDKVQQAAYSMLTDSEKEKVHLKIGRLILDNSSPEEKAQRIFEIAGHLNSGKNLITNENEILELINLNFEAGNKALSANAYSSALNYFRIGTEISKENLWSINPKLAYSIYEARAEAEYLNGNFAVSEELINHIIDKAETDLEKAEVYSLLIIQYTMAGRYEDATTTAAKALRLLHIKLPSENLDKALHFEFEKANTYLNDRNITLLLNSPTMVDPHKIVAMKLLSAITSTAYLYNPSLYPIIVLKMVTHSLKYGNIPQSCFGYATYGLICGSARGNYKKGYDFGWLALSLSDKFGSQIQKCKSAFLFANYINSWQRHIKSSHTINEDGYKAGLDSGDLQFAGYILSFKLFNPYYESLSLEPILLNSYKYIEFTKETNNQWTTDIILSLLLTLLNLTDKTKSPMEFAGDSVEEGKFLESCERHRSTSAICLFGIFKSQVLFLYGFYQEAKQVIDKTKSLLPSILGQIETSDFYFYESLVLASLYDTSTRWDKEDYLKILQENLEKFRVWASNCPENFSCRYTLLDAELARIKGTGLACIHIYDNAISLAQTNGFRQIEAIAQELCGKFLISIGKSKLAAVYIIDARFCYGAWGAVRKVKLMQKHYADFLPKPQKSDTSELGNHSSTSTYDTLDINTAVKASRAIASEIRLDMLLKKTIEILLENAGAERGLLILKHEKYDDLFIQAECSVSGNETQVLQSVPINKGNLPLNIIQYVARTKTNLVLSDAYKDEHFQKDSYIERTKAKSLLCTPFLQQGELIGLLYLENNFSTDVFTPERLQLLHIIASQVVVSINNAFVYANLEQEVQKRTIELKASLDQIKILKNQQDGDYFLTSLLLQPLGMNLAASENIKIETFLKQKKDFEFGKYKDEIGGDICISDSILLQNSPFTVFMNADAMGKSLQGAGGALVLGAVLKAIIERTKIDNKIAEESPERWLKNAFVELHKVFESFEGMMLVSAIFGLIDNDTGFIYFVNIESPITVLYRNKTAKFLKSDIYLRKLGSYGTEENRIKIQTFQMEVGDAIINGSDGRDDLSMGEDRDRYMVINMDDKLFLQTVQEANGNLEKIYEITGQKGAIIDDFSLQKITFLKTSFPVKENKINLGDIIANYLHIEDNSVLLEKLDLVLKEFIPEKGNPYILRLLTSEYMRLKAYTKAAKTAELYTKLNPADEEYIYLSSYCFMRSRQFEKAIHMGDRLRIRNEQNTNNLSNLVECYFKLENKPKAMQILKEIFSVDKENKNAIKWISKIKNN